MYKKLLSTIGIALIATLAFAQEEIDLFSLSLEELMNVEIVSASKKSESLFDAPVSSYTITHSEIAKSGVTSIPEALRLCPGVIVRETTNGNYDIHLRGFDNLVRYSEAGAQNNLFTLVMINDRPVFNYNTGGTIWESLPIDLIDVERIEIVRGPTAPLFGPNAVTGVINIITREIDKKGFYSAANLQYGSPKALSANIAVGNKFNERFSFILSANHQQRERGDSLYYLYQIDQFIENTAGIPFAETAYTNPEQSIRKSGINGFIDYQVNEQVDLSLSLGLQSAETQRLYYNGNLTALSTNQINRRHINLNGSFYNIKARVSYTTGSDNLFKGFSLIIPQYDISNADFTLDYQWKINEKLSVRPSVSYQHIVLDDRPYTNTEVGLHGFVNNRITNYTLAGSLKADYHPLDNLRLIGALRLDNFDVPNKSYASYQAAATYKIKEQYLLRAVHSRSTSGAFFVNYFLNILPTPEDSSNFFTYSGNPDLEVANNTMTELGVRIQPTDQLQIDLTLFTQRIKNLSNSVLVSRTPVSETVALNSFQYVALPLEAMQQGLTLSANLVPHRRIQLKPYITLQRTKVENLPVSFVADFTNTIDDTHKTTPSFYGGAFLNFVPHRKLNLNVNPYYFGRHTIYHRDDLLRTPTSGVNNIRGKLLVNTKLSYQILAKFNTYVTVRNLLNDDTREHYGTDRIGRSYFMGASYHF